LLPPEETQYDVLSGVSVGALNAAYISTFPKGKEQEMAIGLISLWKNLT
jgi:predicted acylesterase/phospholipase RssA